MGKEQIKEHGALSCYRALDLTDEKGQLCGKVLGDLGADVIKIERPGGDPSRNIGPFYHDIPDPEKSLSWFALNANKRGITLNIKSKDGQELFKKLVKTADFVIESFEPGYMDTLGLGYSALKQINPRTIMASVTHFGQTGPWKGYKGSGLIDSALGDTMYATGDPDRAPLQIAYHPQAYCHAGVEAAAAIMLACYHRQTTGVGQYIDVSLQECMCWTASDLIPYWDVGKDIVPRQGSKRYRPDTGIFFQTLWPCKDGFVSYPYMGGKFGARSNRAIVKWMEEDGIDVDFLKDVNWEEFDWATMTQSETDRREEITSGFFAKHTKAELFRGALERHVMLYPVATPKDMVEFNQLRARGFWVELDHPELSTTITYPGAWGKASETPIQIQRRAPLIGEHNREIYNGELGLSDKALVILKQNNVI
jgi:crotonobetainyl-CoA:carnitine CoA-transferase CaiB-like acyl-CoA transferase